MKLRWWTAVLRESGLPVVSFLPFIPARKWVVAECTGAMPDAIQQLWHELCAEFFPTSDYTPTYEMDIEAYPDGDMLSPDYKSQIWIPVVSE
jgi:AraC family transcriptional regulator